MLSSWKNWNKPNKFTIIWHLDAVLELFQISYNFDTANLLASLWRMLFQASGGVSVLSQRVDE